ncbi:SIR2 family protein [Leptospira bouyouniensis]|uniref:SIR2 family protein n=1 Tax=Leptospira bouyouniensis TaxID=2484911 RepID=UPI0014386475|nr:SIR2 family protein [Leptospira bouyouniensis]
MSEFLLPYDAFLRSIKQNVGSEHVVLLGAGASISSGVSSADSCLWEWKRDIFVSKNPHLSKEYSNYHSDSVKLSIQRWLDNEGCYPILNDPEEYSKYALIAYPIEDVRKKYFENICIGKEPFIGYRILCLLAKYGMIRSVFTTNFDGLVIKAAYQTGVNPIEITLDSADRIHRSANKNELLSIALHGDFKYGPLKNTDKELDTQHKEFVNGLANHLNDKHLIVFGYSGRDRSLMKALKDAYRKKGAGLLFWCGHGDEVKPEVRELLNVVREAGRDAYFVPTDGFDNTMIHLSKTCYENDHNFSHEVDQILKSSQNESMVYTPFSMEAKHTDTIIRSNLFPLKYPKELFQFEINFTEVNKPWNEIRNLTANANVIAAPLKYNIYAFGTLNEINNIFSGRLKSAISRTPVSFEELKTGTTIRKIYLQTIIKGICQTNDLLDSRLDRIWIKTDKKNINLDSKTFEVFDAVRISFFFDRKYTYISLNPTFEIIDFKGISKEQKGKIARKYYDDLMKGKPNINFNAFLEKWKRILFVNNQKLEFDYPFNSGSGFKFSISTETMHVGIMKTNSRSEIKIPKDFDTRTLVHHGLQYSEPQLEFFNKITNKIVSDFHPMRGLTKNRPYDYSMNGNVHDGEVNLGIICDSSFKEKIFNFLNQLNETRNAGGFNPDYLIDYPGFLKSYGIPLNIPHFNSEFWKECSVLLKEKDIKKIGLELLGSIKKRIDQLASINKRIVVVVFIPTAWNEFTMIQDDNEKFDLHDQVKAYAAQIGLSTQFIREETLTDPLSCQVNWWLSLSFYVKSMRTPWVLQGLDSKTAFVGIGYSLNHRQAREKVVLGCSHIYNAKGQGLKYRLTRVEDCIFDRENNPFLSYEDAFKFGVLIREMFVNSMGGELPSRVVVHKRTHFKKEEKKGIVDSLRNSGIEYIDLIEINYEENACFTSLNLRDEKLLPHPYPLSRGTCFVFDSTSALLWTHGRVQSVKAENHNYYLGGKNIPKPLKIKKHYGSSDIGTIASEILGLTKMNWNSFDLYSKLPATIHSSNEIARIGWILNRFEGRTYDYRYFM